MKYVKWYLVLLFFISGSLFSQKNDTSAIAEKTENYISLRYDNDFFNATDMYYTQGVSLSLIHPIVRYSPLSYALIKFRSGNLNYYGLNIEQDCFTPRSIRYDTINYKERPYAAIFYVSHYLTSINSLKKELLRTQLDLGVIGPCAKCEEEQKAIHRALVNIQPLGWENQIKSDYIINYKLQFEKGIINKEHVELMWNSTARLGTVYTDLGIGLNARMGFFSPYFNNLGLEKHNTKHKFKLYGVFKLNTKLVGYNATMQGGLFNKTSVLKVPDDQINRVAVDGLAGVIIAYKRVSLEYSKTFITPEFNGGLYHGWGQCLIRVCF